MDDKNALAQLQDNEICEILFLNKWVEVFWSKDKQSFFTVNEAGVVKVSFDVIEEWRPASVKF